MRVPVHNLAAAIPISLAVSREPGNMRLTEHFTYFGCFLLQGTTGNWEQRTVSVSFSDATFQTCNIVFLQSCNTVCMKGSG